MAANRENVLRLRYIVNMDTKRMVKAINLTNEALEGVVLSFLFIRIQRLRQNTRFE